MRTHFRTKLFVASVAAAAVALLVAAVLLSWEVGARQRALIQQRLTDEAHLIADLLAAAPALQGGDLDREADRLGRAIDARVTLIEANGHVIGDSTQSPTQLLTLENHATRPEVIAARGTGFGSSERHSTTLGTDMLYVAVRASHPSVAFVRVALPLTEVGAQLAAIRRLTLVALATAIPVALLVAWLMSAPIARRVQAIARVANRYSAGDLSRPAHDFGSDELGTVAHVLDTAIQELGGRVDELSRDRARTDAILSGMVEGVLVVDRQGRLQLVNRAAQQMLHVDASAVGRPYLEVIRHPDIAAQLTATVRGDDVDSREFALTRDPSRTFVARAAPVTSAGGGGAVLVLHDITDLRRADQIRRDFVANVSHELRTPLTAIRGYVEAVLDETSEAGQTRRFLEIVARQSARMERLVNDLLRLARLDARQETLDLATCDVRQLFAGAIADLSPTIDSKQQHVTTEVAEGAAAVVGDPAKLHDVVRNLLENAVNYSPDGARIVLRSARGAEGIELTIADSGPGIPPTDLTRVFERFYRVDKSRSRPGTGLGLAIVKHLVELHGGLVTAANAPGGGAVFTVSLPIRTVPASA